jgi:hypothetical protein
LFVDASGNVGVGVTPVQKLHVDGNISLGDRSGTDSQYLGFTAFNTFGGGSAQIAFTRDGSTNSGMRFLLNGTEQFRFIGGGSAELMRLDNLGRLGIGTSSPDVSLHVKSAGSSIVSEFEATATAFSSIDLSNTAGYARLSSVAGNLALSPAGTERLRITSAGLVGIGTTSPGSLLQLGGATNKAIRIDSGSSNPGFAGVFDDEFNISINRDGSNGAIANSGKSCANIQLRGASGGSVIHFSTAAADNTAPSERFRCDSSGRLLVGTSTELAGGSSTALLQVAASTGGLLAISRSGATTNAGDAIGEIAFFDNESGNDKCAAILCAGDLDHASGDKPSRLAFSTTADGASFPTERMRIASGGNTDVFSDNDTLASRTSVAAGTTRSTFVGFHSATSTQNGTISCRIWSNGNVQNTNGSYTTLSDAKLKENIVDAGSQWDDLKAIQIRNWNFKAETGHETHRQIGPIAQELETVCPGLVFETPDRDADGNETGEVTKGVNQSVRSPLHIWVWMLTPARPSNL